MPRAKLPPKRIRTRGEGTVYLKTRTWRTAGGATRSKVVWVAAVSEGSSPAPGGGTRRRRRYFYGSTAAQARDKRDRYLASAGKEAPQDLATLADCAARFLSHVASSTRATTQRSYEQVLRLHVLPFIGNVPLPELSAARVAAFYESLRRTVSPSMAARTHVVLRACLNFARENGSIPTSPLDPLRKTAPHHKRPRIEALSDRQARGLLAAAKGHRLAALFVLALTTGMRQGELFALRWSDVDLRRRQLYVVRSAQEVDGAIRFVEPKTESSRRRIALSQVAIGALARRRVIAGREGHSSELVFPSERGGALRKSNFLRRTWAPLRSSAGLSARVRFHDLRHAAASLLLIEGVHPKVVSELLGHSSIRLTLDTFSHLIPTLQATATGAFDRVFGPQAGRKR